MWLDSIAAAPLILFGLEHMLHERRSGVYMAALFFALWCNYYIGYMLCIFACLYLAFLLFTEAERSERLPCLIRFALSSLLAGGMAYLCAGPVLYRLLRLEYDHARCLRILRLVCLAPAAVFFSYPVGEPLYLLLAALSLYMARTGRWRQAGLYGMLCACTRSTGVLLLPLGMELWRQEAGQRVSLSALLPAQALAAGDFDTPRELEVLSESPAPVFRSSGEITVYFIDALNWGTPYAYYWPGSFDWPGIAMTLDGTNDDGQSIYRATIPADTYGIKFNANGLETVDITEGIVDGAMWYPTGEMDGNQYRVERVASFPSQPVSEPATEAPASEPPDTPYDFFLPRDIRSIRDYTFDGADMKAVYIPNGCTEIGAYAFQDCKSLQKIRIPSSVTSIDLTAFSGCRNVTVYGMAPSAAKDIADYYSFSFVEDRTAASEQYD